MKCLPQGQRSGTSCSAPEAWGNLAIFRLTLYVPSLPTFFASLVLCFCKLGRPCENWEAKVRCHPEPEQSWPGGQAQSQEQSVPEHLSLGST